MQQNSMITEKKWTKYLTIELAGSAVQTLHDFDAPVKKIELISPFADVLPRDFNERLLQSLSDGIGAIHIRLDRATKHGQDAEALEPADIRAGGVSLSTLSDIHRALMNVDLEKHGIVVDCGAESAAVLSMLVALREANGSLLDKLHGLIGADPLGTLLLEGTLPISLSALYDEMAETIDFADQNMPNMSTAFVNSALYCSAGASLAQVIAYTLATGYEYVRAMLRRGLELSTIIKHIRFAFVQEVNGQISEHILYVANTIWLDLMKEVSPAVLAELPIYLFIFDLPSEKKAVIEEINKVFLADEFSLAGISAHLVEEKDDDFCVDLIIEVRKILKEIEDSGGMGKAICKGSIQADISKVQRRRLLALAKEIDSNTDKFVVRHPFPTPVVDTERLREQRLKEIREYIDDVDEEMRDRSLGAISFSADKTSKHLISRMKDAFLSGATLAETVISLHNGQNDFYIDTYLRQRSLVDDFLAMRMKLLQYEKIYDERPRVFVCNLGEASEYNARMMISRDFVSVGGLLVTHQHTYNDPSEAIRGILSAGATVVILCGSDEAYATHLEKISHGIKEAGAYLPIIATGNISEEKFLLYQDSGLDAVLYDADSFLVVLEWLFDWLVRN